MSAGGCLSCVERFVLLLHGYKNKTAKKTHTKTEYNLNSYIFWHKIVSLKLSHPQVWRVKNKKRAPRHKMKTRSFIHICIKTNISRAKLSCLASWSMTPDEISNKVSFEFKHFHAFALWLIHNIDWAPVSFFKLKERTGHSCEYPADFFLGVIQWTSATGTTPSSTRGRERFNFQRSFLSITMVLSLN